MEVKLTLLMTFANSIYNADTLISKPDTTQIDTITFIQEVKHERQLPETFKKPFIGDWLIIVILTLLVIIASVRISSEKYLYHLIQSMFNRQTANRLYREKVMNILHPAFRLEIIFYIVAGLFIWQAGKTFLPDLTLPGWQYFLLSCLIIIIFSNTKYILYSINGFLFNVQIEINEYIYYSRSGNRVMGIFLLPIVILLLFTEGISHDILLISGLLIALLFSVISLFRGLKIITQKDFSIYYLILYLCTLEILPILLVWRILWRM